MKKITAMIFPLTVFVLLLSACKTEQGSLPLKGTWRLLTATVTENNQSTVTDYTKGKKFIKIIADTHFAFMLHDLNKGADSTALFSAGGGSYTLKDSIYTEHLEFCSAREWEKNDFTFTVTIHNDTLVQKGIEKVEGTNINRYNVETYVREKLP